VKNELKLAVLKKTLGVYLNRTSVRAWFAESTKLFPEKVCLVSRKKLKNHKTAWLAKSVFE
jgi:hypothetical protein